jgi:AAA domain
MPSLSQHQSNEYTKMLIEGDSGSGKSGALASLAGAGYKLFILDFDNGLETLKNFVLHDYPDKIDNVEFRTLRDKRKATDGGSVIVGQPKAFVNGLKMLDRWKYKTDEGVEIDYGIPAEFGPDCIVVIDSLTFMADAAYDWQEPLTPTSTQGKFDPRMTYYNAQQAVEEVLATLTSDYFKTNVIVNTHIKYVDNPDGTRKGYPTSIGSALNAEIPRWFNSVALCQTQAGGARTIQTVATAMIDLKNPKPFAMAKSYPISTGLAQYFEVLRGPLHHAPVVKKMPGPVIAKRA